MQTLFPELVGKVIPILRDATIKFKKPAVKTIIAYPSVSDESCEKFNSMLARKGRASIAVDIEVRDIKNTVTCVATYNWFVQKMDS